MSNIFYKVGRIYWIKPKPIYGMESKQRPAIMLSKYDKGKTIFLQIGSTNFKHKDSVKATFLLEEYLKKLRKKENFINLDASKPEWNTSVIKAHFCNKTKSYIDINNKILNKVRNIYHRRISQVSQIWIKKAKISIIKDDIKSAKKYLFLLKDSNPSKHKKINIVEFIKNFQEKIQ
ncbi:MAG: hypothetical protein GY679_04505 [Mycoplasma sp.]|nr:hypothetical protein [Mycoplasma sp.]